MTAPHAHPVAPHRVWSWIQTGLGWLGCFLGVAAVGYLGECLEIRGFHQLFLIGSFGASAMLLYGAPSVPYSQPRNVLGGQVFSALVGVAVFQVLPSPLWLTGALAVTGSMVVMHLTRTLHPPGGATALIAALGDERIHALGYGYALVPVGAGALLMLLLALVINNLPRSRRYPLVWW